MKQKVIETIRKYSLIEDGDKIVLGVSGGPDSISMLNILKEINRDEETMHKQAYVSIDGDKIIIE